MECKNERRSDQLLALVPEFSLKQAPLSPVGVRQGSFQPLLGLWVSLPDPALLL